VNRDEIVRAIRRERRRTMALLRALPTDEFDVPTALPGWRIREIVAHLVTTDRASILGLNLFGVLTSTDRVERWNDRQVVGWASRPAADLLAGLEAWGARFARFASLVPAPLYRLRLPTMYGPAPGGLLLWARAFDEWVHRQDIRRALGRPDEDVEVRDAAEVVFLATAAGMPRWEDAGTGRVEVSLTGAAMAPWVFDLGALRAGPASGRPADARIEVPAPAFVMAASGRDWFRALRERGVLVVDGDEGAAERLLSRIRVV
jgi:uncharacterized protein (TIGR03083 family)